VGARFFNLTCQGGAVRDSSIPSVMPLIVTNVSEYQTTLMQAFFTQYKNTWLVRIRLCTQASVIMS